MYNNPTKFHFGLMVFLITDPEQLPRMIVSIKITPGNVIYQCACGTTLSDHYEMELTTEPTKVSVMGFTKPPLNQ